LGLPVLMTKGIEETARFVSVVAKREAKIFELLISKSKQRQLNLEDLSIKAAISEINSMIQEEDIQSPLYQKWQNQVMNNREKLLANLPGIGPKAANNIMKKCGDIMGLCLMTLEEISSIDGVSSIQAIELYKFLHGNL